MLKRTIMALGFAASLAVPAATTQAAAPTCHYVLGFSTIANAVGQVGACVDDQAFAGNGDALQHTSGGLLVWRKLDNWTAFTDGYHTWINGPNGLQERLNTARFDWEAQTPPTPAAVAPAAASPSTTASIPSTSTYTPPTAASLGLTGASVAAVAPPIGDPPTAAELEAVTVPAGALPLASLPSQVQLACVHLSEDLLFIDSKGSGSLRQGDLLCPYGNAEGWAG